MRILFIILSLTLIFSCSNSANDNAVNDSARIRELPDDSSEADIIKLSKEDFYVWRVNADNKTIRKNPAITDQYLNVDTLIVGLNEMYPNIKLEKIKQGNDTLYTQIKNAAYLTDQMGSAGPEAYIAQAILNLTSIKGINFVKIDFEPGSHAVPDVWSREHFKDYKEVPVLQFFLLKLLVVCAALRFCIPVLLYRLCYYQFSFPSFLFLFPSIFSHPCNYPDFLRQSCSQNSFYRRFP